MLSAEEKKELIGKLQSCKSEISGLRSELDKANEEKEKLFAAKEEFSKEIVSLISDIKKYRKIRDELTKSVQDSKVKRTELNKEINEAIAKIKELQKKRKDSMDKSGIQGNPAKIKKEMEAIEFKIETEPMDFNTEQKLMKRIRQLKKEYGGFSDMGDLNKDIKELSKHIDGLKKQADEIHHTLQTNAVESQKKHEEMIQFSHKVDELKKKEQDAYKEFFSKKEVFSALNLKLKEHLKNFAEVSKKLEENNVQASKDKKKKQKDIIEEKQMSVQEKIEKGKKLTTEDLLAFQKIDDKKGKR
jgi:uncharacterized coiled-coil DUF342 family protein